MIEPSERNRTRYLPVALLVASGVGLLLLLASFVIRVRVIVEQPAVGDATATVAVLWWALLGIATLGSFAVGVYDLVAGIESPDRPPARSEASGDANDVDFHVLVAKDVRPGDLTSVDDLQSEKTVRRPVVSEPGDNGTSDGGSLEEF